MPLLLILLMFASGSAYSAAISAASPDITDAIAVASVLTMFGLGFISGAK